MLRSIVSPSQPLLTGFRWPAAAPGGAKPWIVPSRAYAGSATPAARCNGSPDETTTAAACHLYVVLEEHAMNIYSIYKLPGVDEDAVGNDKAPRRLPRAALHLRWPLVGHKPQFEALGSQIAIYGYSSYIPTNYGDGQLNTLLYDTKTGTLDGARALPDLLDEDISIQEAWIKHGYHAAAPIGNRLCVLEAIDNKPFYLYELERPPYISEWTWKQGPLPLPLEATDYKDVELHAVHPDGHTIFASSSFTLSLNTKTGESADRGKWLLPFHGRGYYDNDLDAWVGIR